MKMRALGLVIAGCLVGCSGSSVPATSQLSYDLTVAADRAQWRPVGLTFEKVVGPYAVYRVTGSVQRLDGPRVRMSAQAGGAVVGASRSYFAAGHAAGPLVIALRAGSRTLALDTILPTSDGNCTPPSDQGGSGDDGGVPPVFDSPDGGAASDGGSGWGSGCSGSGGGGSGSGGGSGYGSGGGGYGSGSGGGGYGSGSGGYGSGSGGGSGYGNPGGYGNGGWNMSGCMDAGTPPVFTPPDDGGSSDSSDTPTVAAQFVSPAPVGSTVVIRSLTVGGGDVSPAGLAPSICCSSGDCSLASDTPPVK